LFAYVTYLVSFDAKPFDSTFLVCKGKFSFTAALHFKCFPSFVEFNKTNSADCLFFRNIFSFIFRSYQISKLHFNEHKLLCDTRFAF
jgi:hypothetical protein